MNFFGENKPSKITSGIARQTKTFGLPFGVLSGNLKENSLTEVTLRSIGNGIRTRNIETYEAMTKPFKEMRIEYLSAKVKEQDEADENYISKGYAYSTYYHFITRIINRHEDEDYVHVLIESELFDFVLKKLNKVEGSKYVENVFKNINRENLTHYIPFFTLLIERLMRILTDKVDDDIRLRRLKSLIKDSLNEYEVVHKKSENTSEEESEIAILEREISENAKELYEITFNHIVQEDFMQNEDKVKGNILNRHTLLHGKQNFDKIDEDEAMKLVFLILFFLDLIDLKNKGELILK